MVALIINTSFNPVHRPLRVVHLSPKAYPFDQSRGLAQVLGRLPGAQKELGLDVSLILPLNKNTKEYLQKHNYPLEKALDLKVPCGMKTIDGEKYEDHVFDIAIYTIKPFAESLVTTFLIAHDELFGKFGSDEMYGWANDLVRFSVLCKATLALLRKLGGDKPGNAPDIIECHDWQTALLLIHLFEIKIHENLFTFPSSDKFFNNTRSVFTIHEFRKGMIGEFERYYAYQAGIGWASHLPSYVECDGKILLLKGGLYTADRSTARSHKFIEMVADGIYGGQRYLPEILKERIRGERLAGIFPNEENWTPAIDFTDQHARDWAKISLGLYRSLASFPFQGMEHAQNTTPVLNLCYKTPQEKLEAINPEARKLFDTLSDKDKLIINRAIEAGEEARFVHIKSEDELRAIVNFLKILIDPEHDFEALLRNEGIGNFLIPFNPGDLNRVLSIKINIKDCADLLETAPDITGSERITLYEAFSKYEEFEGFSLLDHIVGLFKSLKRTLESANKSDEELTQEWHEREEVNDDESLASAIIDFRERSEILSNILKAENQEFYRAFLIGVLLHDLGKLKKHAIHAFEGGKLFNRLKEIKGLLGNGLLEFTKYLIIHHSALGDTIVMRQQNPDDLRNVFYIYNDSRLNALMIKCLYLLGFADVDTGNKKSKLTPESVKKARDGYHAVLFSKDLDELNEYLEKLGFGEAEGESRWNKWVVREKDSRKQRQPYDSIIAEQELEKHCCAVIVKDGKENNPAIILQKAKELMKKYKKQLGIIEDINKIDVITNRIDDTRIKILGLSSQAAALRARLLIWLIEYSFQHPEVKNFCFEFTYKKAVIDQELSILLPLLDKFNIDEISNRINITNVQPEPENPEQDLLEISIKV